MNQFEDRYEQDNLRSSLVKKLSDRFIQMSPELQDKMGGLIREHRLEYLGTKDGVRYINDAASTSANALWFALSEIDAPIILITGNPKADWDWLDLYSAKVEHSVVLEESDLLIDMDSELADSMMEAVRAAHKQAKKVIGATVLFSPGCQINGSDDYQEIGQQFKHAYNKL